jgi:hypothetical protein
MDSLTSQRTILITGITMNCQALTIAGNLTTDIKMDPMIGMIMATHAFHPETTTDGWLKSHHRPSTSGEGIMICHMNLPLIAILPIYGEQMRTSKVVNKVTMTITTKKTTGLQLIIRSCRDIVVNRPITDILLVVIHLSKTLLQMLKRPVVTC